MTLIQHLAEPPLEFRYAQRARDPHQGLSLFGPFDAELPSHPGTVRHGAIGTREGLRRLKEFLSRLALPVFREYGDPDVVRKDRFLWPTFPGLDVAFGCAWPATPAWSTELDGKALHELFRNRDPHKRAFEVCNHYLAGIERAAGRDEKFEVIVCVVPDELWEACRRESRVHDGVGEKPRASEVKERRDQPDLFKTYEPEQYDYSVDFRR